MEPAVASAAFSRLFIHRDTIIQHHRADGRLDPETYTDGRFEATGILYAISVFI